MAHSVNTYTGDGSTTQFAISFTLGFISRDHVQCRVADEVDGLGDPVYRSLTWINDGLVEVQGDVPAVGEAVVFTRTVPKDELVHDYSDGAPIEEENLDESNLQNLMAIHEFLDGRLAALSEDLDMGNNKIINLVDPTNAQDAATKNYIDTFEALNTTVILASVALAEQWAEEAEDIEVEAGQYSAKHHALKSADSAAAAAASEAQVEAYLDSLPLHNYTAIAAPTVNDDTTAGYSVGSNWYDVTNNVKYVCLDATDGAAVWLDATLTLDDLGSAGLLDFVDEDDMTSDSATAVPSQQSVKAYVDAAIPSAGSQAQIEAETSGAFLDGANAKHHPGVAKCWGGYKNLATFTTYDTYNVTSIADTGTGIGTVTVETDFADTEYCVVLGGDRNNGGSQNGGIVARNRAVGSFDIRTYQNGGGMNNLTDWDYITFAVFGAQS